MPTGKEPNPGSIPVSTSQQPLAINQVDRQPGEPRSANTRENEAGSQKREFFGIPADDLAGLTLAAVPEPSTFGAFGITILAILILIRRSRRR
ncbi:MAG: PEP-CTERM sorting domain-containing protein [Verrucomicrobiae bacterium]|nr:PEP-CTERM sorting domain-containing protein [Verrucomicrobiae bacterium]